MEINSDNKEENNNIKNNNNNENAEKNLIPSDYNIFLVTEIYGPVQIYNNERFYFIKTSDSQDYSFEPESNFINKENILEKLNVKTFDELNSIFEKKQNSLLDDQKYYQNKYMKKIKFQEAYLGDINIDIPLKIVKHVKNLDKDGDLAYEIEWKKRINNFKPLNSICFHSLLEENYSQLINEFLIKNLYC